MQQRATILARVLAGLIAMVLAPCAHAATVGPIEELPAAQGMGREAFPVDPIGRTYYAANVGPVLVLVPEPDGRWIADLVLESIVIPPPPGRLYHLRELRGIECKSGATVAEDALRGLLDLPRSIGATSDVRPGALVYGGDAAQRRHEQQVVPWRRLPDVPWIKSGA